MTKYTKKNVLENNNCNNALKSYLNQRKYFMNIIVAMVHFMVIYSQLTILYQQTVVEVYAGSIGINENKNIKLYCAVVIDAGSTGTRILAAAFIKKDNKKPILERLSCCSGFKGESYFKLKSHLFLKTRGGLNQYPDDEQKRDQIVRNLLNQAVEFLKNNPNCKKSPFLFRATAGLRLLREKSDEIIYQVNSIVSQYSLVFQVNDNSVAIMDSEEEGLFAWFTVNYLLDRLKKFQNTVAVLDLGGGSLQITHYVPIDNQHTTKTKYNLKEYSIMGVERQFYNQSYLGFGMMEVRTKIFISVNTEELTFTSLCHHTTKTLSYTFSSKRYNLTGQNIKTNGVDNYKQCFAAVKSLVEENVTKVTFIKDIVAISFFYDTALEAALIGENGGDVKIQKFNDAAVQCFHEVFNNNKPFKCFDLTYIYVLLNKGFGFPENSSITVMKHIDGFELSWALGAAYEVLIEDIET